MQLTLLLPGDEKKLHTGTDGYSISRGKIVELKERIRIKETDRSCKKERKDEGKKERKKEGKKERKKKRK